MKKDLGVILGLALIVVALLVVGRGFTPTSFLAPSGQQTVKKEELLVTIRNLKITAKIAALPDVKRKGLSRTDSLPPDRGMLFVFDKSEIYGFWMKDMRYAIDIIWIGEDKSIVYIAENVPPELGKKDNELKVYKPNTSALYVLEISAGLSKLNNLQVGDKVDFTL